MPLFNKKEEEIRYVEKISISAPEDTGEIIKKASSKTNFKGEVVQDRIQFPKELGEAHPYDFKEAEGLYSKFGFVTGVIDKLVDFVWGSGFYTKSENERAKKIVDDWVRDVDFDFWGRRWFREGLIKGTGVMELGGRKDETVKGIKLLNSNYMFVERDKKGNEKVWRQYIGNLGMFDKGKVIEFQPYQIASITVNQIGDSPYGLGLLYPARKMIDNLLKNEKDLHTLIARKANSPIVAKLGNVQLKQMPSPAAVDDFAKKMEHMTNKTEWATDANVEMKVLDFGNVGERFDSILKHDIDMLFFTFQVPEVLMGRGSIPEGLAKVQLDAFQRRIQSFQVELEKVIENKIFRRVLQSQGMDAHVEFEWGQPSNTERNERLAIVTELLKLFNLNPRLRKMLEEEVASQLNFNVKDLETPEEERKREEGEPQPEVPGQKQSFTHIHEDTICPHCEGMEKNHTLREWLGFDYDEYKGYIEDAIRDDKFKLLKAVSSEELTAGRLSDVQIVELKAVLTAGFAKEKNIREIADDIAKRVKPKDLFKMENGKIVRDVNGEPILKFSSQQRPIVIARSETTRMANLGAIRQYKASGVGKYTWVAAMSERTCPECEALDGQVFDINSGVRPPLHTMCRCATVAITEF